jgi:hypothetical protein
MSLTTGRRSERVPWAATSVAAAQGRSGKRRRWRLRRRWSPTTLTKGAGGLIRGASPSGAARWWKPLLVAIPPPGGVNRGVYLGQPSSARPRCWWCAPTAA